MAIRLNYWFEAIHKKDDIGDKKVERISKNVIEDMMTNRY